ncbi:MAG: IreB family regulatory phosphoprotein [Erysipelothrix sp.]|nr:IreB family regulatory phosphoprotein [Erysipelothrix sp.]
MSNDKYKLTETMAYDANEIRKERINDILHLVDDALKERGYQSVNQISGYLISNDPAYISSHKDARNIIQEAERHEIIEELVRFYLANK